jgi:hypothetical protein
MLSDPPVVSVMRAQVFDIMWAEAYWDRLLGNFLATQDPRKIMKVYQISLNHEVMATISLYK